ncbi:protein-glutamate O-methyltransferase CheR [Sulfurimonas sp.]|uniref:CheR family methyltransferase n=1 Tax=Sulfurimonas sp. TaxID=2022749 RepID=UPI0035641A97
MNQHFSIDNFEKIKEFIYRKTGISIDYKTSYKKLNDHIKDFKDYFFKLRFDDENGIEFQKLINLITNNDTYFYREKEQFEILVKYILPELDKIVPKSKPIRILSAPCSSGEEVYSILIYILEKSDILKDRKIEIIGADINSDIIQKAYNGVYNDKSMELLPADVRTSYFTKITDGYKVDENLKKYVDFKTLNLFDKDEIVELGKFDLILSRNMLVHFDEISRKAMAMNFYEILNDNGFILLGDAEHMSRIVPIFNTTKIDGVFVHKK